MKKYEKPVMIDNRELAFEGIFAAGSGVTTSSCKSIYMNGVYVASLGVDATKRRTYYEAYGCTGCPANWGRCAATETYYNKNQDSRPQWEREGHTATEIAK
jgi:hypothetical protein